MNKYFNEIFQIEFNQEINQQIIEMPTLEKIKEEGGLSEEVKDYLRRSKKIENNIAVFILDKTISIWDENLTSSFKHFSRNWKMFNSSRALLFKDIKINDEKNLLILYSNNEFCLLSYNSGAGDKVKKINFLELYAGGNFETNSSGLSFEIKTGISVFHVSNGIIDLRSGLNLDTMFSIGVNEFNFSLFGIGFMIDRKSIEINTPSLGLSLNLANLANLIKSL